MIGLALRLRGLLTARKAVLRSPLLFEAGVIVLCSILGVCVLAAFAETGELFTSRSLAVW